MSYPLVYHGVGVVYEFVVFPLVVQFWVVVVRLYELIPYERVERIE